ncbi:pentapeptide repeat-containing protein, partial [Pseudomonas indica]|uniref:pentapeptide repeat-containing protein n=1 Tax=Pseudomonas indica TaxID=137658 RepID=UPI0023FA0191
MLRLLLVALLMGGNAFADDETPVIGGCRLEAESHCLGANLRNADLSHLDLRRINLSGADLRGADLRHSRLDLANLE